MLELLHTLFSFFIILSVIVFVHEFGHYIVAKWCGVKIDAFSIGFGKEIWGRTDASGTRWKLSLLPLGGYVKMFGDASEASTPSADLEKMTDEEKNLSFHHKKLWQKAAIVAAGPVANFLLTIAVMTYFILAVGLPSTEPVIGEIMPNTPAERAGLLVGDRIVTVNGEEVSTFNDIPYMLATNLGTPVDLLIERAGSRSHLSITPESMEDEDALGNKVKRPIIGIKSKQNIYDNVALPTAVWEAIKRTYAFCETTLRAIGQMVSGERHLSELKGPVGIAKFSGQAADKGVETVLWFIAMLSANLGLINLFPIPLLDGGHLAFYAIEAARGKPLAEKFQDYGFKLGMALLATLMIFTLFNDIRQLLF